MIMFVQTIVVMIEIGIFLLCRKLVASCVQKKGYSVVTCVVNVRIVLVI